jgi:hypothetical protein
MLTHDDWLNLLNLHENKKAFWTTDGFLRCKDLLSADGASLSPAGRDKVHRLLEGIAMLKAGVPLSRRIANRRDNVLKDQWVTVWRNSSPVLVSKSCLILGKVKGIRAPEATPQIKHYFGMWFASLARKEAHWRKVIPYAAQIDDFGGTEAICFHTLDKKEFWRIQSKYYDLIAERYPSATWWVRGNGSMGIAAKIISSTKPGITNGILAVALTLDTSKSTIGFPAVPQS